MFVKVSIKNVLIMTAKRRFASDVSRYFSASD